jgi:hypothetical protein
MAAQGLWLAVSLDHSKQIGNVWKLCATMRAEDVTATLDLALRAAPSRPPR